ncbi:hypothetical protein F7734_10620 [Scytonema sp. UIC 10036]|uniref:DUF6429 family protein n=1 Tax=Scytonema sp. UIC 10036 TaxID=2304196 RepID=UPI0012DA7A1D|nr:hypothetical protein [Scytonema sp. UIC 10036]MUG92878.1 hypothetical protein [Scytonema sp. UIC 10036]
MAKTPNEAYSQACQFVDEFETSQDQLRRFMENYQVLKPLYLMIMYLSSWDKYNSYLENLKNKRCPENFLGIEFWNGFDFEIVNRLEAEGLLEISTTKKTLRMNFEGMRQARNFLMQINLDGVETLLEQREYHEEYINCERLLDITSKHQEEEE